MRGGGNLVFGINQTLDFIFYNGNTVLVHPNPDVTGNNNDLCLIGTFAGTDHNKTTEVSIETAKKRCLNKLNKLGITVDLDGLLEIKSGFNPYIEGDVRYTQPTNGGTCTPKTCPVITQVFAMEVKDKSKFEAKGTEFVDLNDPRIFIGHHKILEQIKETSSIFSNYTESEFGGGRRTRKRKSKKTKKSKKAKKSKKSKKTHRRRR